MIRILAAIIVTLGCLLGWQTVRLADTRTELAEARQEHAEVLRDLADKTAAVASAVRERERIYQAETARAADTFQKDKAHAIAAKDSVIAGLRSDNLRLRAFWNPRPAACAADTAAPALAGGDAEAARLRAESAGRIVGNGAAADGWIRWLQAELIATRLVCIAPK